MTQAVTYERETKSVVFQGKIIVLESLTPVLPPKEKEQRKKEMNCTPFVRQYGILFKKWGVFVCQRDNESTTERRR